MNDDEFKITEENEKDLYALMDRVMGALKEMDDDDVPDEEPEAVASDRMRNICTGSIAMMRAEDLMCAMDAFLCLDLGAFGAEKELGRIRMHASLVVKSLVPLMDKVQDKLVEFDQWKEDGKDARDLHHLRDKPPHALLQGDQEVRHLRCRPEGDRDAEQEEPQDQAVHRCEGVKPFSNPLRHTKSDILYTWSGYRGML